MKTMQNLHYVGSFSTLQTQGNSTYLTHKSGYSEKQNELYNRLLYGLKCYTPEELYAMNSNKKKRITMVHKKAQTAINIYKQEKLNSISQKILGLFTNIKSAPIETDPSFFCTLSFKDLGIEKEDLINLFINRKLLPANFAGL